ncbi:3-phenylpropionate/trans-cinnamate dioxygenase ferredoxin subunit [Polaromonas sp. OV174]|uniref:non-heme iron oxygenase ferredoxin subunit n=1 Tax=Polaromonas sp. OV174 TaxID=1855300 RepID=UPI0008EE4A3E|nr:non-heme iron oxygenase ferredoxin subunit [Polaromonas sp. OV174]SFB89914.1 3-phenylpropionate/trans-cinnamate dioxygenase ferredoxin subunit [Polaromonas sp. OV174]
MADDWKDACSTSDVDDLCPKAVFVEGREIAIYRVGEEFFATDNLCTHGNARLCDGYQENHEIECPLHQGRFDVRSGKALCAPLTVNLKTYSVIAVDGRIRVALQAKSENLDFSK